MKKLGARQKRFCEEYLVDLNATQAAIRAGYKEKTARSQGQRLLTNVDIQKYISELQKQQSQRTGITADTVLKELKKIALTDTEISGKEKIKALELLGKHLGMFSGQQGDAAKLENELPMLYHALEQGGALEGETEDGDGDV